ncbi:hypothetical protein BY996DRAFT_2881642 [Phakopsora pachyrhizi]|uniref:RecQ-mediated genome instability protein 1 n=1 Tax=Phakopsora pachyrhizi TaxID=170000 RepID=A0AAV0B4M0_PHAPC|nr:hypothetical protein BY996DRAFT_2881351 [Phakopsora pachyrhizi]KAI8453110.1 hypothetical protein BY996DRAFT_2881642 [Phakopsora pachyrhizi]CAH7677659.1 hypothetical protein PPACK8108_LOCUS12836 [Phakopsora pachyrhizi]
MVNDGEIPRALTNWFKGVYPNLTFDKDWLRQCYRYLREHFELSGPQLIKKVENQLLLSDLSASTSEPVSDLLPLPSLITIDREFGDFPKELSLSDRGVLVQIQSMTEIGQSAISLENVHKKLMDATQGRDRVIDLDDEINRNDQDSQEQSQEVKFPRSMLRFELSDGHRTVQAVEYKRIKDLELGVTPLGCKLLLRSVVVRRGILLLTPENTTIKGYGVDELDCQRDQLFQLEIDTRLGRKPTTDPSNKIQTINNNNSSTTTTSIVNTNQTTRPNNSTINQNTVIDISDDSDEYFEDSPDFEAQLLAQDI